MAVEQRADSSVLIRCKAAVLVVAERKHTAERDVVFLCGVQCYACTCEKVVALSVVVGFVSLVSVCVDVVLLAPRAAFSLAMMIAYIGVSVDERAVVVNVERCVGSAACVGTCLNAAIIARLAVFLQYDIDDTCRPFSRELRRRVVYYLNAVDTFGRQLLQHGGAVVACKS